MRNLAHISLKHYLLFLNIYKCSQYFDSTLNDRSKTHQKCIKITCATRYNVNRRPHHHFHVVKSVQSLSHVQLSVTPWIIARQASLSITNSRSLPKLMCINWWCHPAISSSVVPLFSCPQSLPPWGSFPMSQLFALGGQSIGVLASASVLPMYTQDWSPLG